MSAVQEQPRDGRTGNAFDSSTACVRDVERAPGGACRPAGQRRCRVCQRRGELTGKRVCADRAGCDEHLTECDALRAALHDLAKKHGHLTRGRAPQATL